MSQELFYTSAPSGLRPGSRGFCTVMSTSGMAKNLADRLEALSGYRHVFPANDPKSGLNPVVYSHLRITVGGLPLYVLSRVCAAGLDYTQRSNKFAHHVVLDQKELVPAGPAAVLATPGFMEATWEGEPRVVGLGRKPPRLEAPAAVCRTWEKVTGDAGWAGVLAETATAGPSRVATVIFQPGMDTLALVAESLALLPSALRWQVTFSTYYTKLPPEVQCQWRFALQGSPEAKAAQRSPNTQVIDLTEVRESPHNCQWAHSAREGKLIVVSSSQAEFPKGETEPKKPIDTSAANSDMASDINLAKAYHPDYSFLSKPPRLPSTDRPFKSNGSRKFAAMGLVAFVSLFLAGYIAFSLWPGPLDAVAESSKAVGLDETQLNAKVVAERRIALEVEHKANEDANRIAKEAAELKAKEAADLKAKEAADLKAKEAADLKAKVEVERKAAAMRGLELPYFDVESAPAPKYGKEVSARMTSLEQRQLSECKFDLLGGTHVLSDGWEIVLDVDAGSSLGSIPIIVRNPHIGISGEPKTIATIHRNGDELGFSRAIIRSSTMMEHSHQLANCLLRVSCGQMPQYIALRSPVEDFEPIAVSFDLEETTISLSKIHNWPSARVVLDVPTAAEQLAAAKGYVIDGRRTEIMRITTSKIDWPHFELTVDPKLRQVALRYQWQLLQPFQGTDRLGQAIRQLEEEEKSLGVRKGVLERRQKGSGITKADYDRLQVDIDKINNVDIPEIDRKQAIFEAVRMNGLDRMMVPFLIAMEVDHIPVLIAKSRD